MWRREPLGLLLLAAAAAAAAGPALGDTGGSGDGDEASASAASPAAPVTMAAAPSEAPGEAPGGLAAFLRDYALLAAVAGSLALVLLLLACAALLLRRRHKAAAYYPSSFPAKKYVDASDRAGGARGFGELPEAAPGPRARQPAGLLPCELEEAARGLRPPGARRDAKGAAKEPNDATDDRGDRGDTGDCGDAGANAEMPPVANAAADGAVEGGDGRAALD